MFTISRAVPVNDSSDPDQPTLTRSMVWHGLALKAENALPLDGSHQAYRITKR